MTQLTFGTLLYTVTEERLILSTRGRLHNQLLTAGVLWDNSIVALCKDGDLLLLGKETNSKEQAKISLREAGRKLVISKDGEKVIIFTMTGSVFSLSRDQTGVNIEDILAGCSPLDSTDYSSFRSPLKITDLDFLKQHSQELR